MDAPLYPPATTFVQPERVAYRVSTRNTPIAELMKMPAAWAKATREVPGIGRALAILRARGTGGTVRITATGACLPPASAVLRLA